MSLGRDLKSRLPPNVQTRQMLRYNQSTDSAVGVKAGKMVLNGDVRLLHLTSCGLCSVASDLGLHCLLMSQFRFYR